MNTRQLLHQQLDTLLNKMEARGEDLGDVTMTLNLYEVEVEGRPDTDEETVFETHRVYSSEVASESVEDTWLRVDKFKDGELTESTRIEEDAL